MVDFLVYPAQAVLIHHQFFHGAFNIWRPNHKKPPVTVRFIIGQFRIFPDLRIHFHDDAIYRRKYIGQVIFTLQPPARFALIQFLTDQRQIESIGLAQHFQCKVIQSHPNITAAFDSGPGMSIMEIVSHGDIETLNLLHFSGECFGFCSPDIFKILIKVTFAAFIIIRTHPLFNAVGKAVAADPIQIRSSLHGCLPADLFAFGDFLIHGMIVFTAGAIIIIVTIFEFYHPGLHPKTGSRCFGFLVRFDQPNLTAENRFNLLLRVAVTCFAFLVSRPESDLTPLCFFLFFSHFPRSFSKINFILVA